MTIEVKPVIKPFVLSKLPRLFALPSGETVSLSSGASSPRPMARLNPVVIYMLKVDGEIKV